MPGNPSSYCTSLSSEARSERYLDKIHLNNLNPFAIFVTWMFKPGRLVTNSLQPNEYGIPKAWKLGHSLGMHTVL
ncbi:hypothetical protein EMCRGX_G011907 [Ephydatia muelleri]